MQCYTIATADGPFTARFSNHGLSALHFPDDPRIQGGRAAQTADATVATWLQSTARALRRILAGEDPAGLPPLDLSAGTEFQQMIWRAMLEIPAGKTLTYAQIASQIGRPSALRAAGGACGANPVPVIVPCHRIVAAHGLGGFSGGLPWKRKLLQREGVLPAELI